MTTFTFDSVDLERTEEFLSFSYAPMRIGSTTERSRTRIIRDSAESISADDIDIDFEMSYEVRPLGKICLCSIRSGTIEDHRVERLDRRGWTSAQFFGPGDMFLLAPPERQYGGRVCRSRYSITTFEPALFEKVATAEHNGYPEPVRLLGHRPITRGAGRSLQRVITHVVDDVLASPSVSDNPVVVSTAAQYLAACVLNTFPNNALINPTAGDRRDGRQATVRRAVAYIEAHANSGLSVADVAGAAGVTIRAVQLAFRRHLDTTPMQYLRCVRLARAHLDLVHADPSRGDTVTAIAIRWGFLHQGRFTAAYRAAYGRPPSATLRAR